jgi:hypothetical protein
LHSHIAGQRRKEKAYLEGLQRQYGFDCHQIFFRIISVFKMNGFGQNFADPLSMVGLANPPVSRLGLMDQPVSRLGLMDQPVSGLGLMDQPVSGQQSFPSKILAPKSVDSWLQKLAGTRSRFFKSRFWPGLPDGIFSDQKC